MPTILNNIYLSFLFLAIAAGAFNFKYLDNKAKIIFLLLILTGIGEVISFFLKIYINRRTPVYHFSAIISLFLVSLYFIKNIFPSTKPKFIVLLGSVYFFIGIADTIFFENLYQINTNVLILRGFLIIAMALFALYKILIDDTIHETYNYIHFWLWILILCLYGFSYFFWSYIKILSNDGKGKYQNILLDIHGATNVIVYGGLFIIFLLWSKRFKNERAD